MLEAMLYGSRYGVLGYNAHRCSRCGSGHVNGSDGFMMSHCMNCGHWQDGYETKDLGVGRIKGAMAQFSKKAKAATLQLFGLKKEGTELTTLSK